MREVAGVNRSEVLIEGLCDQGDVTFFDKPVRVKILNLVNLDSVRDSGEFEVTIKDKDGVAIATTRGQIIDEMKIRAEDVEA